MAGLPLSQFYRIIAATGFMVLIWTAVQGQGALTSARQLGMGRTFVAVTGAGGHLYGNPALMDVADRTYSLQMNGLRPFGLTPLQEVSASGTFRTRPGSVGAGIHRYGNKKYSEIKATAGIARNFNSFLLGGTLQYTHIAIQRYGSAGTLGISAGAAIRVGSRGWIGAAATNINRPVIGAAEEELPQTLTIGASWQLSEGSLVTSEILKALRFPPSWRGGLEMEVLGPLLFRVGAHTRPTAWSVGIGLHMTTFRFDFGLEHHQLLGFSYGVGVGVRSAP